MHCAVLYRFCFTSVRLRNVKRVLEGHERIADLIDTGHIDTGLIDPKLADLGKTA